MNFKPNILKCAISLLTGIITDYLLAGSVRVVCMLDANNPSAICPQPNWMEFALDPVPVVISIIVIILVYIIWSLIQKK